MIKYMNNIITKEKKIIATRDFIRDFARISTLPKNRQYLIVKHGKPVGTYVPYQEEEDDNAWWNGLEPPPEVKTYKKHITLADLKKLQFHSGEKNLSQKIDEIVYGITR